MINFLGSKTSFRIFKKKATDRTSGHNGGVIEVSNINNVNSSSVEYVENTIVMLRALSSPEEFEMIFGFRPKNLNIDGLIVTFDSIAGRTFSGDYNRDLVDPPINIQETDSPYIMDSIILQ